MAKNNNFLKSNQKKHHPISTVCAIFAMVVFAVILTSIVTNASWVQLFDAAIRTLVFSWQPAWWTHFVKVGTQLFNTRQVLIILVIAVLVLGFSTSYRDATFLITTTIAGTLINTSIKAFVGRPRPSDHVLMHYSGYSFPSGHSIAVMIVCSCLIIIIWRHMRSKLGRAICTFLLGLVIIFIGYSRIYVSAHFPSDVIGGWSLGFTIVVVSWHWFYGKITNQARDRVQGRQKH